METVSPPTKLSLLRMARDEAAREYMRHRDTGGLTPSEKRAFELEEEALSLFLEAAQLRYIAEQKLIDLLHAEHADAS